MWLCLVSFLCTYVLIPNIYRSFLFLLVHIISSETTTIKITTHVLNTAPIIMPGLMLLVSVLPLLLSGPLISMVSLVVVNEISEII